MTNGPPGQIGEPLEFDASIHANGATNDPMEQQMTYTTDSVSSTKDAQAAKAASTSPQSLDDAVRENLITGTLLLCKEALVTAIQDRRLHRGHLRVLAAIATYMNSTTAKAWPGRAAIADLLAMPVKTVSNLLLELRNFGYLLAARQAVEEANNRKLTVYTWGNIDHETIRREIGKWIDGVRNGTVPLHRDDPGSPAPTGQSRPNGTNSPAPTGLPLEEVPSPRVRKSRPSGDSNSVKEQKIPYGGARAPEELSPSVKKLVWTAALQWIVRTYNGSVPEAQVRSRLGLLIKDHGQGRVLDAVVKAETAEALDPLDFITGVLRSSGAKASASPWAKAKR